MSIIKHLRSSRGCPWDRKQTLKSLQVPLLEETYEVLETIVKGKSDKLQEELGDLLCVIFMIIAIGEDRRLWKKKDIINSATRKMKHRHPHVFGSKRAKTPSEAIRFWKDAKRAEGVLKGGILKEKRMRGKFPALLEAEKIQSAVAHEGFDWERAVDVLDKIEEETKELRRELRHRRKKRIESEIGDLLFSIANLSRKMNVVSELALHNTNRKFRERFKLMEEYVKSSGKLMRSMKLPELDRLWDKAKRARKRTGKEV